MKIVRIALISVLGLGILVFSACKSEKEKQYNEIVAIEKSLFGDRTSFNDSLARVYLSKTDFYINNYKDDVRRPDLIFKSGEVLNGLKSYSYAIRKFQDLHNLYPNDPKAAESIFLCGFIYDTYLQKYDEAGRYYKMFIKKYPTHPLAKDAQISIDNLGKSPEELVKEFEKKNVIN
jgi:tetratricopeptide (TPR) repeat protein